MSTGETLGTLYNVEAWLKHTALSATISALHSAFFAGFKIGHSVEAATAAPSFRISADATGRHGSSKEF